MKSTGLGLRKLLLAADSRIPYSTLQICNGYPIDLQIREAIYIRSIRYLDRVMPMGIEPTNTGSKVRSLTNLRSASK